MSLYQPTSKKVHWVAPIPGGKVEHKPRLIFKRFQFNQNYVNATTGLQRYYCKRNYKGCKARVEKLPSGEIREVEGQHTCNLRMSSKQIRELVTSADLAQAQARNLAATPGEVLGEHASSLDDDGLKDSLGGTRDREAKRLMRVKARMLGYKKSPGTKDFVIPDVLRKLKVGEKEEDTLWFDSGRMIPGSVAAPVGLEGRRLQGAIKKQRRILVLGYEGGRKLLSAAKTVMVDGTFKSAPRNFTQVVVLSAETRDCKGHRKFVPCSWLVLPSKKKRDYMTAYLAVKRAVPGFSPEVVISDFEKALFIPWKRVWPRCKHRRCFFHFRGACRARIQRMGLAPTVANNGALREQYHMLVSLCFVDPHLVPKYYSLIVEKLLSPELQGFARYFGRVFVGRVYPAWGKDEGPSDYLETTPLFPVSEWNMRDALLSGEPLTQNATEAGNGGLQAIVGSHPGIYRFLGQLKKVMGNARVDLATAETRELVGPGARLQRARDTLQRVIDEVASQARGEEDAETPEAAGEEEEPEAAGEEDGARDRQLRQWGLQPSAPTSPEAEAMEEGEVSEDEGSLGGFRDDGPYLDAAAFGFPPEPVPRLASPIGVPTTPEPAQPQGRLAPGTPKKRPQPSRAPPSPTPRVPTPPPAPAVRPPTPPEPEPTLEDVNAAWLYLSRDRGLTKKRFFYLRRAALEQVVRQAPTFTSRRKYIRALAAVLGHKCRK